MRTFLLQVAQAAALVGLVAVLVVAPGFGSQGRLLWQQSFEIEEPGDFPRAVMAAHNAVFVAGNSRPTAATGTDLVLRAYDARTGNLRWKDQFDLASFNDSSAGIVSIGELVVVAGYAQTATGDTDFLVRAYRSRDGALAWQDRYNRAGNNDSALLVATSGERLFVAGVTNGGTNPDLLVRTYHAKRGTLVWQDHFDLAVSGPRDKL